MDTIEITKQEYEALMQAKQENEVLKGLVASLTQIKAELEARLNKSSKTSNKPPSSDGLGKNTVINSRVPSGRQSGGQPGHGGKTRELNPIPDTIVELQPKETCECGGDIIVQTDAYTIRQKVDVAPIQVLTIEYRAHEGVCEACEKIHKASFPQDVRNTVYFGEQLSAILTYLNNYQLLPLKRTTELMEDLFGVKVSQGVIVARGQEAYEKLAETEAHSKEEVLASPVANADETGARVNGRTHWLHVVSTETCTVYAIHEKRGKAAMDDMDILRHFTGTLVHDHWKSYYGYDQCAHAECNAHHLRHLKYLHENLSCAWAGEMACLLLRIKKHVDLCRVFGADSLEQADIEIYEALYHNILAEAEKELEQSAAKPVEASRMIKRMKEYAEETLLFMLDLGVPFTNNLAERDVRMPKAKQKISGGFRSKDGANAFARVRGFVSTTKKKGKNVLEGLKAVFQGNATKFLYP